MHSYKNIYAFSLIEVLIWILVVSIIMVWAFQTLTSVGIWKVKLIEKTSIEKEAFFAAEKLFEMIKKGGTIDYEEYWNRNVLNMTGATLYNSWHYAIPSWFWNFWRGGDVTDRLLEGSSNYYCLSQDGSNMWTGWCLTFNNVRTNGSLSNTDYTWLNQRYGQYQLQFIDYNSDADSDAGDEDGSSISSYGWFFQDDDDLFLWIGPPAFTGSFTSSWQVQELYLIDKKNNERTLFRFNVVNDPFAPTTAVCTWTQVMIWSWCLWTIEILKLTWLDEWLDHSMYSSNSDGWYTDWDGLIDTWVIHRDYDPNFGNNSIPPATGVYTNMDYILAHNWWEWYWQSVFSDKINVSNFEVFIFPNKDSELSWKDTDPRLRVSPYVQIKMTLQPSWKTKRKIQGDVPDVEITTTIHLSELDFK